MPLEIVRFLRRKVAAGTAFMKEKDTLINAINNEKLAAEFSVIFQKNKRRFCNPPFDSNLIIGSSLLKPNGYQRVFYMATSTLFAIFQCPFTFTTVFV